MNRVLLKSRSLLMVRADHVGGERHGFRPRSLGAALLLVALQIAPLADRAGAAPGYLDSSFGGGGTVATSFGAEALDVAIQPDARIVAAGHASASGTQVFAAARFLSDGSLDPTFGGDGTVTTGIGCDRDGSLTHSIATAVVIQRLDGLAGPVDKVLLGGYRVGCGDVGGRWVLVRYEPDGSLDPSFGVGGVVKLPFGVGSRGITDLALDGLGRIVAVGSVHFGTPGLVAGEQFGVARLLPNGAPDPSFGEGGMTVTMIGAYSLGEFSRAAAVALTTVAVDGGEVEAIVVAGQTGGGMALARYLPNGALDPTFGTNGTAATSVYTSGGVEEQDLVVQADGKLVVAAAEVLARFTSFGGLDGDFAGGGFVRDYRLRKAGVAVHDDGAIVAGGYVSSADLTPPRFGVARYRSDGSADASFGDAGTVTTLVGGTYSRAHALALQPHDGMIVLAGGRPFKLARYQWAGPPATVPEAPALTATAGNASVHLAWTTPLSGASAISGYRIYRGTAAGAETLLALVERVNSFGDTAVANGTRYFYRVSAVNAEGEGALSNEVSAIPATVPGAPSLTATAGNASVHLAWTAPPDGGSAVSGHRIYRGTAAGAETFLAAVGSVNSFGDTAVVNGTRYFYRVSAVNAEGEGALSNEVSAIPATVPSAPSLTATAGKRGVALSWTVPPSGGSPISGYRIYRSTTGGGQTFLSSVGTVTSYKDNHTTQRTTYYYVVRAVNDVGEGSASNEASATAN